jgi:hypothetical protein
MGKVTLYVTNTIFMLLSIALVALGGYVLRSDWKDFFKPQFVYAIIAGGAFMMIMSCLGCAGAHTQKKRFLCPYATVIFMCLCAQLAGAALAMNFKGAMDKAKADGFDSTKFDSATQTAYDYLETQWTVAFTAGDCNFTPSPDPNVVAPYWSTKCTNEDGKYLETFMNTKCNDDAVSYDKCKQTTGLESPANQAFCNCQVAIVDKVEDALGPVTKIAIAAAAFEFFLVIASCALMCQDRKGDVPSQDTTQPLSANQYGHQQQQQQQQQQQGAAVPANGANMV